MSDKNIETVRAFWRAIGAMDVEGYANCFAENAVAHDPADQPPLTSDAARREFISGLFSGFSEIETRIDFVTPCGDACAAKWTIDGRSSDGDPVHIEGIDVYNHDADGKLTEMWGYFQA